ncbi:MAG: HEAT repeat domain-containing protein [Bryobacteraceae bacterium]|nr:HEAT repeat domain-containing protein [Bryobacteraceae bacterium]MDW8378971.1 HEAT repeat domain-containing protein [Bryobacterales bacterium]
MQQSVQTAQIPAPQSAKPKPEPPKAPPQFTEGSIANLDVTGLVAILKDPNASEFQKAKACMRAGELADKQAVPALAALLPHPRLSTYARYGLEPVADESASQALRMALSKVQGELLIGVINSIGKRRDSKALPALTKLLYSADANLAQAAASAIGKIGGEMAVKELRVALGKTKGQLQLAIGDAALVCAEQFLAAGKRKEALAIYAWLSAPDVPKSVRLAAMHGVIREETSPGRPR